MTREPIDTKGHYSGWLWHWVCDRIGCKNTDMTTASKNELPSPEEMQRRGWFVAKIWGDRCPECVAAGNVESVEPWGSGRPVEDVEMPGPVLPWAGRATHALHD